MAETFDYQTQFETIKKDVAQALTKTLDVRSAKTGLRLQARDVYVDDSSDSSDWESQREAVRKDKIWGVPVYATVELTGRDGQVLSTARRVKVATLPKPTDFGSFIVDGKHYQVQNQLRLKPGVYITRTKSGQNKAEVNIAGRPFEINYTPNGVFTMTLKRGPTKKTTVPLYPVLSQMGVTDSLLAQAWGEQILARSKALKGKQAQAAVTKAANFFRAYEAEGKSSPALSVSEAAKSIADYLENTELRPEVTKLTLGKEISRVTPEAIVLGAKELLSTVRGERQPDDRHALQFKKVFALSDLMRERYLGPKGELSPYMADMRTKILRRLDNQRQPPSTVSQAGVSASQFTPAIAAFFKDSTLASTTDQTNPINMLNGMSKITVLGEGGIADPEKTQPEEHLLHPSHLGFVDPVHTPDSSHIGMSLNLPIGASKRGDELEMVVYDLKTKQDRRITPSEAASLTIGFPDQFKDGKSIDSKIRAMVRGEDQLVDPTEIDVVLKSSGQAFSISTNSIPFRPAIAGVRAQMSTKMLEQALPLLHREAPRVQVDIGGRTLEDAIGSGFSVRSLEDGIVKSVGKNRIVVQTADGEVEHPIYSNLPLNKKSFLNADSTVKVGDRVKKGDVIADSNFTKDGVLAMGVNLRSAFIPYKGLNFEDGVVVTESAAKKLTSEHVYQRVFTPTATTELGRDAFTALMPTAFTPNQEAILDDGGVVKKGTILKKGDPLWVGQKQPSMTDPDAPVRTRLGGQPMMRGIQETWTEDHPGEVVDVVRIGKKIKVYVKTQEPAMVGDKISNRSAAKGIITKIIPDGQAPRTADGQPVDILLNPAGIPGRINPSQMLETAAAKLATVDANGRVLKPYAVDNNDTEDAFAPAIAAQLAKAGIADEEMLFDPQTNKPLGNVLVGPLYTLKLDKQATSQFSARSPIVTKDNKPRYNVHGNPLTGGDEEEGSKALDMLSFYSMLSHGARSNLKEMATTKSTKNDEFWKWLVGGHSVGMVPPAPAPTLAYKKFEAYLKGAGVNVKRNGTKLALQPLTDREVEKLSSGVVEEPVFVRGKDLKEEKGGLFDPFIFGGRQGDRWGHLDLAEPIPNPIFETPIKALTGLKPAQYNAFIKGKLWLNPATGEMSPETEKDPNTITGGEAIKALLGKIDVDQEIKTWTDVAKQAKDTTKLDQANKRLKYLTALKKLGVRPEEVYIRTKMPILPPVFRPVIEMEDGSLSNAGLNTLYRDVSLVNNQLAWQNAQPFVPDWASSEARESLYNGVKALTGLGEPIAYYPGARKPKGIIEQIKGPPAKKGYFQREVLRRAQEPTGRGTIIPEPKLGTDEVGLPKEMAWTIYQPFVLRRLVNQGLKPLEAEAEWGKKSDMAQAALDAEMDERPVLLNRAPSLHKFSIMAFKPQITDGHAIKIPPLVVKGFGADFDGDQQISSVLAVIADPMFKSDPNFWGIRSIEMTSRLREQICYHDQSGHLVACNLEDFPHTKLIGSKGHIDFYEVPDGISVVAMDEASGRPVLARVQNWSHHKDRQVEIVTLGSGRQIITDDDERAVYGVDAETLEWCRRRPSEASNQFVPVLDDALVATKDRRSVELPESDRLHKEVILDQQIGWFLGAMIGDGWGSAHKLDGKGVHLASIYEEVKSTWSTAVQRFFIDGTHVGSFRTETDKLPGSNGCDRLTVSCAPLSSWIRQLIGAGCRDKHLPPFAIQAPVDFVFGLLAGLWDTDGTMGWVQASVKPRPQFQCSYSSTSIRLLQEIQHLLRTIKISSTITSTKTPIGRDFWMLGVSIVDLHRAGGFPVVHGAKSGALHRFLNAPAPDDSRAYNRYRLVPIASDLARDLMQFFDHREQEPYVLYSALSKAKSARYLTIWTAQKIAIEVGNKCAHPLYAKWIKLLASDVHFEQVVSVERTKIKEDGYDLTVPGYETFMAADGVVLSNTMSVHVPVLPAAVQEAHKLMPSRNLYNPGTGAIMMSPQNESALGLYMMSIDSKTKGELVASLPADLQAKYKDVPLNESGLRDLMRDVATSAPDDYGRIVSKLKEQGDEHVYRSGFSVGLKDLSPKVPEKDKIFLSLRKQVNALDARTPEGKAAAVALIRKADDDVKAALDQRLGEQNNGFHLMAKSGARGKMDQIKQIVSAPLAVDDHRGAPSAIPVLRSFAEGLPFSSYWSTLYGARSVAVDKQLQTSKPGAFNKDIMATTITNVVSMADCGDRDGIDMPVDNSSSIAELTERFLARDVRVGSTVLAHAGDAITSSLLNTLRDRKVPDVHVRSPLSCKAPQGTCAKCYGLDEHGKLPEIGTNIGAIAGQSISEPLTQMTLRTIHSGGISGARGGLSGYAKIDKLLKMEKFKTGKAQLARRSGKIVRIDEADGGRNVFIGDDEKPHFVPTDVWEDGKVRAGSQVRAGDPLSGGIIQPQELVDYKGMPAAQRYIADQIHEAFTSQKVPIKKKIIETVVRSVGNTTKIMDPADSFFLPGDVAPYTVVQDYNNKMLGDIPVEDSLGHKLLEDIPGVSKGEVIDERVKLLLQRMGKDRVTVGNKPIRDRPFLTGLRELPMLRKDWLSQMGYQRLKEAIVGGVAEGQESDIHGYAPVPAFVYGSEFNEPSGKAKKEGVY